MRPLSQSLADFVVPWIRSPWPLAWSERFGRTSPLSLEVGFGNGEFLAAEARERPERDHVGIELSWASTERMLRRLEREGIGNVRLLLGDAELLLDVLFAPESLVECFVIHPCPWPKGRHAGRRLVNPRFLALAARALVPDGRLSIATDHAAYAAEIGARLAADPAFRLQADGTGGRGERAADLPGGRTTKYERKARAQGASIHRFVLRRVAAPAALPPPLPAAATPHLPLAPHPPMLGFTLLGTYDPDRLLEGLTPYAHREQRDGVEVIVRFPYAYRRADGDDMPWLVEAFVHEGRLEQAFGLLVLRRREGGVLVRPSALGDPRPTYGVRRAVALLGEWLARERPGLAPAYQNLGVGDAPDPEGS